MKLSEAEAEKGIESSKRLKSIRSGGGSGGGNIRKLGFVTRRTEPILAALETTNPSSSSGTGPANNWLKTSTNQVAFNTTNDSNHSNNTNPSSNRRKGGKKSFKQSISSDDFEAAKEIARQTRMNTRQNAQYKKVVIEWKPVAKKSPSTAATIQLADLKISSTDIINDDDDEGVAEMLKQGDMEDQEEDEQEEHIERQDEVAIREEEFEEETKFDTDDEELIQSNKIKFARRVSITKFHKRKSPRTIGGGGNKKKGKGGSSKSMKNKGIGATEEEEQEVKPIIRTCLPHAQSAELSPTKYTIHVNKFVECEEDEEDSDEFDLMNSLNDDGDWRSGRRRTKRRKRKPLSIASFI